MLAFTVAGCGESSNQTSTSSNGGKTYGPACQHELTSAACLEEQEAKNKVNDQRVEKEQQKALSKEREEVAEEATEQEKEREENSPIK